MVVVVVGVGGGEVCDEEVVMEEGVEGMVAERVVGVEKAMLEVM